MVCRHPLVPDETDPIDQNEGVLGMRLAGIPGNGPPTRAEVNDSLQVTAKKLINIAN